MFVSSEVSCCISCSFFGVLNPGVVLPHMSFRGKTISNPAFVLAPLFGHSFTLIEQRLRKLMSAFSHYLAPPRAWFIVGWVRLILISIKAWIKVDEIPPACLAGRLGLPVQIWIFKLKLYIWSWSVSRPQSDSDEWIAMVGHGSYKTFWWRSNMRNLNDTFDVQQYINNIRHTLSFFYKGWLIRD